MSEHEIALTSHLSGCVAFSRFLDIIEYARAALKAIVPPGPQITERAGGGS